MGKEDGGFVLSVQGLLNRKSPTFLLMGNTGERFLLDNDLPT